MLDNEVHFRNCKPLEAEKKMWQQQEAAEVEDKHLVRISSESTSGVLPPQRDALSPAARIGFTLSGQ